MTDAPADLIKPRYRVPAGSRPMMSGTSAALGSPSGGSPALPHQGASIGRRLAGWRPTSSGPNAVVSLSAPELLRRSRDLRRNNANASRAMDLLGTHMVGMGIKPRSLCKHAKTRDALTQLWADWCIVADADSTLDFYGMQSLAVSEMIEAGESFARLRPRRLSDGLPVPLQLQLIPAEQIPLEWTTANGGNPITQGIERNPIGTRTAFWAYPQHPGDQNFASAIASDLTPRRVPAADICHLFNTSRIGQMRGLPWLASVMTTLQQLGQYIDAELLRKILVAGLVGYVKKPMAEDTTPSELEASWGNVSQGAGELPTVSQEPGTVQYLNPGEEIMFNAPAEVGGSFEAFIAATHRSVASGSGVLYEELTGDWRNMNDRTYRAAFNTFKRQVRGWQYNLICVQFNIPIWNRFVDYAVSSGAIVQNKSLTDADLRRVEWRAERWDYIQPVQDLEASGLAIGLGLTSRSAEIAERGDDVEVIDAQIAGDREREAALDLKFPAGTASAVAQPNATQSATSQQAATEAAAEVPPGGPAQQQKQGAA